MTVVDAEWFGSTSSSDAALLTEAPGGALSEFGRQAAVEQALSLLGVYFSSGEQASEDRAAISSSGQDPELEEIRAGLRLRVALAAARRLIDLLSSITKRPTFRYALQSTQEVGSLSGALDVNRWVTRQRGGDADVTFPIVEVTRGTRTPENTLASYATLWLRHELATSLTGSLAAQDSVEYTAARSMMVRLDRLLRSPVFGACISDAKAVRTRAALDHLLTKVRSRLRRREIAHSAAYRALMEWVDRCLHGQPAVSAGLIDLSVYGTRFDNKLFELWCLSTLSRRLATAANLPDPLINPGWRVAAPAYSLRTFTGRVDLFFQRGIATVDKRHAAKWRKESGRPLGGIPDIVARTTTLNGVERLAVIDPKLRQRDRLPAEELYKILGYLQNFDIRPAVGIVLIYTTDASAVEPDVFRDGAGGTLISASLNPAAPPAVTDSALREVVRVILALADLEISAGPLAPTTPAEDSGEGAVRTTQTALTAWGQSHLAEIAPSRERIRTLVGDERWSALVADVQTMVATADLVGYQLDPTADFSGPVIGMSAAVEHLIYNSAVGPVVRGNTDWERQTRTFGAIIDTIDLACAGKGGALPRAVRTHLDTAGLAIADLQAVLPFWRRLNATFRVPAAHRKVLTKSEWQQVYRLVMGSDMLFTRTHDVLRSMDASPRASTPTSQIRPS